VIDQSAFFRGLGQKVRDLRRQKGFTQEDMISFGFSARHWQQIEAGRPITVRTLLRIGKAFSVSLASLVGGLDDSDEKSEEDPPPRAKL
jgi:transcriptional regulator with XRE-family HTH domain